MSQKQDIQTPEGYFENLQARLQAIPAQTREKPTLFQRVSPALAYAASLLVLLTIGSLIFRKAEATAQEEDLEWAYVAYLAQSLDPDGQAVSLTDVEP